VSEPPRFTDLDEARTQAARLSAEPFLGQAVEALSEAVAVLNARRQIVFANPAFRQLAGFTGAFVGLKPGELFGCTHAAQSPGGCGQSPECWSCGASQAFLEARDRGVSSRRPYSLMGSRGGREVPYDLEAAATPFRLGSEQFVLLTLRDVSHQKHKAALERIFFHDILNTASSLKVYLGLLGSQLSGPAPQEAARLLADLRAIADALVEEIMSQKQLVSAENRTLRVSPSPISSRALAEELLASFARTQAGGQVSLAPAEDFSFVSDAAILRRVLGNMLRNALEAAPPGGPVTLGFTRDGSACRFWVHNPGAMPEEVRRQVFRRYFSTKGRDRGLGTYSMKLLTEEYLRGEVGFTSDEPSGTKFTVTLPLELGGASPPWRRPPKGGPQEA
jgi:signal transduction histidine kinase